MSTVMAAFALLGIFMVSLIVCVFAAIKVVEKMVDPDEGLGIVWLGGWAGLIAALAVTALAGWYLW